MPLKNKITALLLCFSLLVCLCSCAQTKDPEADQKTVAYVDSMDTFMTLTAYGSKRAEALNAASAEIYRLNDLFSIGVETSEIAKVNADGHVTLSSETLDVVKAALYVNEMTGGCFDITVTPLMELWGFTTGIHHVPCKEEIDNELLRTGLNKLNLDEGTSSLSLDADAEIDLGGIAKGYTSQRVMEIFKENGVKSGIVSLGGNVQCLGLKPDGSRWKVAIRKPWASESSYAAVLEVEDCAVISSGGYERYFEDEATGKIYSHILDPKTGYPVENDLDSVTIICNDGTLADGLSTSLFIMGLENAVSFWKENSDLFELLLITKNNNIFASEGIEEYLKTDMPLTIIKK